MPAPAAPRTDSELDFTKELLVAQTASLRRLGRLAAESDDPKLALRAAEAVLKFAGECRREDARLEVARVRAGAKRPAPHAEAAPRRDPAANPFRGPVANPARPRGEGASAIDLTLAPLG